MPNIGKFFDKLDKKNVWVIVGGIVGLIGLVIAWHSYEVQKQQAASDNNNAAAQEEQDQEIESLLSNPLYGSSSDTGTSTTGTDTSGDDLLATLLAGILGNNGNSSSTGSGTGSSTSSGTGSSTSSGSGTGSSTGSGTGSSTGSGTGTKPVASVPKPVSTPTIGSTSTDNGAPGITVQSSSPVQPVGHPITSSTVYQYAGVSEDGNGTSGSSDNYAVSSDNGSNGSSDVIASSSTKPVATIAHATTRIGAV